MQKFIVSSGVMCWKDFFISKMVSAQVLVHELCEPLHRLGAGPCTSPSRRNQGPRVSSHDVIMFFHCSFSET